MVMDTTPDKATLHEGDDLLPEHVETFLRDHPDFLATRPDLLRQIAAPARDLGDNVSDWQVFLIDRLRADKDHAAGEQQALVERTRRHRSLQDRVHAASLTLMGALDLDHLVEIVTSDVAILLGVDVVNLCVETETVKGCARMTAGVRCLAPGTVADIMDDDRDVVLRETDGADERLFAGATPLVQSEALARFGGETELPNGILALGSRRPDHFRAGDPVELYRFLAMMLDRCLRKKLGLPF
jgi:uncharacterized protein YigA (DUF484 family)